MKKILLPIAFVFALGAQAQGKNLEQHIGCEGVPLWTSLVYGKLDEFTLMDTGIYVANYDTRHDVNRDNNLIPCDASGGSCYAHGKIYTCEYDDAQNLQNVRPHWCCYDAKTQQKLFDIQLGADCSATTTCLAYDLTTDKIYGILKSYLETRLVEINPETGDMTVISDVYPKENFYLALACSPEGTLYATYLNEESYDGDQTQYLVRLRKSDGKAAVIGKMNDYNLFAGDIPYNMKYAQAMCFNQQNGKMYWMYDSSSVALSQQYTPIFEVNTTNADMTMVSYLKPTYMLSGMFFVEPEMTAPGTVGDVSYDFAGTLTVEAPTCNYKGVEQSENTPITIIIEEDGNTVVSVSSHYGELCPVNVSGIGDGNHTVQITVEGEDGLQGPTVDRSFYVGHDTPEAPHDVVLTAEDNVATITWSAPQKGANGGYIDKDFTYTIIRYPGAKTVARDIKETTFTETLPESLARYRYTVKASDGTKTSSAAASNDYIIGMPLEPPFYADFAYVEGLTDYFSFYDNNNDGTSWSYYEDFQSAFYAYNIYNKADDYLISPPFHLKKGYDYSLVFDACSYFKDFPESFEVCFGTGRTPTELGTVILSEEKVPAAESIDEMELYSVLLPAVEDEGTYYFAFHVTSEPYMGIFLLRNIMLGVSDSAGIGSVSAPSSSTSYYDLTGRQFNHKPNGVYIINGQKRF